MQVIQELERQASRAKLVTSHSGVDLEYLKNIMLQLYQTGSTSSTLLAMLSACSAQQLQARSGNNVLFQLDASDALLMQAGLYLQVNQLLSYLCLPQCSSSARLS